MSQSRHNDEDNEDNDDEDEEDDEDAHLDLGHHLLFVGLRQCFDLTLTYDVTEVWNTQAPPTSFTLTTPSLIMPHPLCP